MPTRSDGGLPAKRPPDPLVVRVSAVYTLGALRLYVRRSLTLAILLHHVDQLIDRHQFRGPKIDRLENLSLRNGQRPVNAIVDVHERSRLSAVPPDLDGVLPPPHGVDY